MVLFPTAVVDFPNSKVRLKGRRSIFPIQNLSNEGLMVNGPFRYTLVHTYICYVLSVKSMRIESLHFNSFFLSPVPKLKWYKVDSVTNAETEIIKGGDYVLTRFNQFLTIKNVAADKAGKYKCIATNKVGSADETGTVKVAGTVSHLVCCYYLKYLPSYRLVDVVDYWLIEILPTLDYHV